MPDPLWHYDPIFGQQTPDLIYDIRTCVLMADPDPHQRLNILLFDRFNRNRMEVRSANGLGNRQCIVGIILITPGKGLNVLCSNELHLKPFRL